MMLIVRNESCPECLGGGCGSCSDTGTLDGHLRSERLGDELVKADTTEGIVIAALCEALDFVALIPGLDAGRVAYLCGEALDRLGVDEAEVVGASVVDAQQRFARARMEAGD